MTFFTNLKIAIKIAVLILSLGVVTLFVVFNGASQLGSISTGYAALSGTTLPSNTRLARISDLSGSLVYAGYKTMAYDGASKEARDAAAQERRDTAEAHDLLRKVAQAEPAAAAALRAIETRLSRLDASVGHAMEQGLRNDNDGARRSLSEADQLAAQFRESIATLIDTRETASNDTTAALAARASATQHSLVLIGVIGVIVAIGASILVTQRTITGPLGALEKGMRTLAGGTNAIDVDGTERRDEVGAMARALLVFRDNAVEQDRQAAAKKVADADQAMVIETVSGHLERMAKGDLTQPITREFPPSYAELRAHYNAALASLRDLIGAVSDSARTIRAGSSEIEQASEDLARRTEASAASLEETSAAVTQINDRLRTGADNAHRTVERADQAIATVGTGRGTAGEAVQAMHRVSDSAKGIDSVIEGLDKIAFQTRVLAMNAAVEAGRAGESGRGFAVVADLVGQLAMRSEEEAKRAREQLTTTQNDVVLAVDAVHKVDRALLAISDDVGVVHELLASMSVDNAAQAAAIQQIATAIHDMDEGTQKNAAMVEEASAAARNLNGEVGTLTQKAAVFTIGQHVATAKTVARPVAKAAAKNAAPGKTTPAYLAPVKPLPAAAIPALVRDKDDWDEF
ncbi:methyl-accepting chemotaxis protein [Sphingomonas sp. PAMC 26617]|uniref:methyl-accepting chemotaxis protein n=1 Tax=Sphingomonas sp. PAMC 26617 TaxID=1112216 RepID=UPI000287F71D|nr:methyl-accepting chemotaxis protein [Sphingomonas sp. PAMC 26617]